VGLAIPLSQGRRSDLRDYRRLGTFQAWFRTAAVKSSTSRDTNHKNHTGPTVTLNPIDIGVIIVYFVAIMLIGLWVSKRGTKDLDSYFLGGKTLPWYILGVSNASGMFDITGTMWLVGILFVYGLKSIWLPFHWPIFNQIFLMVFLSAWLRRSNVLTGAEWIRTRFGSDTGANLAHISVVCYALANVVLMLAYAFEGIGKFAAIMLPWSPQEWLAGKLSGDLGGMLTADGVLSNENIYAIIVLSLTAVYAIKGGMISVVITEVMQFLLLTIISIVIGVIALCSVSPDMIANNIPDGWLNPFFGWTLDIDWSGILDKANSTILKEDNELFGIIFGLMVCKGMLASLAGPAPNYDMQRVLATRSPREACLMSGMVSVVLYIPRYMLIAGLTVLALGFCMGKLRGLSDPDFEQLLPIVMGQKLLPVGVVGLLLAGLLAAFMSTFAATLNAAPAYLVNDIYKRFMNPNSTPRVDVRLSRITALVVFLVGIVFGLLFDSINDVMMVVVSALYGGYAMANVLKWYWWRFNGQGYFWGMIVGLVCAGAVPPGLQYVLDMRSPLLSAETIQDLPKLAASVSEPAESDAVSPYLRSQLSPEVVESLASYEGGPDPQLKEVLAKDFNRIIEAGPLYAEDRFPEHMLSDRAKGFLKKDELDNEDRTFLNRILLENAYPRIVQNRFSYGLNPIFSVPLILLLSVIGCLLGTLLAKPEDEEVLERFYKTVRPWGAWGPIREKVMAEDPTFQPNRNFCRDWINILVGIVWQVSMMTFAIFLVLRSWQWFGLSVAVLAVTSLFLKLNWYDKLEKD
jgi:SSS family solute:Na+ symporter